MEKIYERYINEGKNVDDKKVAAILQKQFGVKVKKIDARKIVTFTLVEGIDESDFANFELIDNIHAFLKKTYGQASTEHAWNKFVVEQL